MTPAFDERAVQFDCEGDALLGIVARGVSARSCGVLIVVGGPQYRVGSHRQFTLLARRLAGQGYPTMRFDYRGVGDSEGGQREFDTINADIDAAISAFRREVPGIEEIVLLGLCDGASAAMMYAPGDLRVRGMVILNPWVRSTATLARVQVRHYYPKRVLQRDFWRKLLSGRVRVGEAARGLAANVRDSRDSADDASAEFVSRMRAGLARFSGRTLLMLSGNDLVAREFQELSTRDAAWRRALSTEHVQRVDLPDADHTFSRHDWTSAVERHVIDWLREW